MSKNTGFYDIKGIGKVSKSYLGIDDRTRLAFNSARISLRDCISDGYICNISGEDASKLSSNLETSLMTVPEYGIFLNHIKQEDPEAFRQMSKENLMEILKGSYQLDSNGKLTSETGLELNDQNLASLVKSYPTSVEFSLPSRQGTYGVMALLVNDTAIIDFDYPIAFRNDQFNTGNRLRMREVVRN